MSRILLLEDDTMIASGILYALETEGYETNHPCHGQFLSGNAEAGVAGAVAPFQKIHEGKHAAMNDQQKENVPAHVQF